MFFSDGNKEASGNKIKLNYLILVVIEFGDISPTNCFSGHMNFSKCKEKLGVLSTIVTGSVKTRHKGASLNFELIAMGKIFA